MGPKCYAAQCIVNGEENPQNCPFPLGLCHPAKQGPSHGHRLHAQKLWKDCACRSGDILMDRQTHTHTDMRITAIHHHYIWGDDPMCLISLWRTSQTEFNFLLLKSKILTNYFEITHKVKKEWRNLTINGKNYQNARRHSQCYYGNSERWRSNEYTSDFDAWM